MWPPLPGPGLPHLVMKVLVLLRWSAPGNMALLGFLVGPCDHGQEIPRRGCQLSVGVPHPQCLAATSLGAVIFGRAHPLSPAPFTCSGSGVQGLPPAPAGCWLLCKGPPYSPSHLAAPRGCEQPHVHRLTACSPAVRSPYSGHIVTTPACCCMPLPLSFSGPRFGVKALLISQSGAHLL